MRKNNEGKGSMLETIGKMPSCLRQMLLKEIFAAFFITLFVILMVVVEGWGYALGFLFPVVFLLSGWNLVYQYRAGRIIGQDYEIIRGAKPTNGHMTILVKHLSGEQLEAIKLYLSVGKKDAVFLTTGTTIRVYSLERTQIGRAHV